MPDVRPPQLVRDVVHDIVAEVAPDELVLFAALENTDDEAVVRRLTRGRRSREPLGFGLAEAAALVLPVVWIALDEVVRTAVAAGSARASRRWWTRARSRLRRRPTSPQVLPTLSREQLTAVRDRVNELAAQAGIAEKDAAILADLVVARLVLMPADVPAAADQALGTPIEE